MQGRKTGAVGVDGEHGAVVWIAAANRRPIQRVSRENQSGGGISSVVAAETMQVREIHAIGVDGEDRAIVQTAATSRRPIQGVARYNQSASRV